MHGHMNFEFTSRISIWRYWAK